LDTTPIASKAAETRRGGPEVKLLVCRRDQALPAGTTVFKLLGSLE
jgi:hypothetical protein